MLVQSLGRFAGNILINASVLHGTTVNESDDIVLTMGTACSGSEILATFVPHLEKAMETLLNVKVRIIHTWSCEAHPHKCEWIKINFPDIQHIFMSIEDLATDHAYDYKTGTRIKPPKVHIYAAGTSCRDASRFNIHQLERRGSISQGDHSTGLTFMAFAASVQALEPEVVLLENVPSMKDKKKPPKKKPKTVNADGAASPPSSAEALQDDPALSFEAEVATPALGVEENKDEVPDLRSNYDLVKEALNAMGYVFCSSIFDGRQVGIPQRRERLYMGGVKARNAGDPTSTSFVQYETKVQASVTELLQMQLAAGVELSQKWPLHICLCPRTSTFKEDWMPEDTDSDSDEADVRLKWYELHMKHWATLSADQQAKGLQALEGCQQGLTTRMKDVLALLYADAQPRFDRPGAFIMPSPLPTHPRPETLWDLGQNIGRVPTGYGYMPCALPRARCWLRNEHRFLSGCEALLLQGADPGRLPSLRPGVWSSTFVQDMAGNAFCVPAFGAWLLSLLASI